MSSIKLDSKKYSFSKLEKEYKGMNIPDLKIKIDGKDIIKDEGVAIEYIEVDLSIENADSFEFIVTNAYDLERKNLKWIDKILKVGKEIEISLGYRDAFKEVFFGYITSITIQSNRLDNGINIIVAGFDKSFLMMRGEKSKIWKEIAHSDIIREIGKRYTSKQEIDSTNLKYNTIGQMNQSDYDFIKNLAQEVNYEFFITGDTLYFRKYHKNKSPVLKLSLGENILNFDLQVDLAEQISSVVVRGWDSLKKEEIKVEEKKITKLGNGKSNGPSIIKKIGKENTVKHIYSTIHSSQEGKKIAKAIMEKTSMSFVVGNLEIIGVPQIRPGRYIEIENINEHIDNLFYITKARHIIDEDGYRTNMKIGGNTL